MPTIDADSNVTAARSCPLCDTPLKLEQPNACPKCDWVLGYRRRRSSTLGTPRDRAAVLLSMIPGLGHFYKGHAGTGLLLLAGGVFATFACVVAATATAGFGLLLLPLYWAGVMLHVYWLEDRHEPSSQ